MGFSYLGEYYTYCKDVQDNILAIIDKNGRKVVEYYYDAWGNCKAQVYNGNNDLAQLNPFRYRSYYYDIETGFYYLKSRYYDPAVGRFINIDSIEYADPETINGLNLYAYCGNNPVMYIDPDGTELVVAVSIGLLAIFLLWVVATTEAKYHYIQNTLESVGAWLESIFSENSNINIDYNSDGHIENQDKTFDSLELLPEVFELNRIYSKSYNPDPYARPGQKKMGRERIKQGNIPIGNREMAKGAGLNLYRNIRQEKTINV